jgi:zinc transport system substrate-binding protein
MKRNAKISILAIAAIILLSAFFILTAKQNFLAKKNPNKLLAVATIFPLYDFAKNVGGKNAAINLLLRPGTEAHSYEPTPGDIININNSDVFIYANRYLEPWVDSMLKTLENSKTAVIDSSRNVTTINSQSAADNQSITDPHIWLDPGNAKIMVDNIANGFAKADPKNKDSYLENASRYKEKLSALDDGFKKGLADCRNKIIIDGGHNAFAYLAKKYGLTYFSAQGADPEAEPTAQTIADLANLVKINGLDYVFYQDFAGSRTAQTIAAESGAGIISLNAGHEFSASDFAAGIDYIGIMEKNLQNLRIGLQCK